MSLQNPFRDNLPIPSRGKSVWQPKMPVAPDDQRLTPEEPYGIPEDWDWREAELGPNNEALPFGAKSWSPRGEAFYGGRNSLEEWYLGFLPRIMAGHDRAKGLELREQARETNALAKGAFREGNYKEWLGLAFTGLTEHLEANVEGDFSILTPATRATGEVLGFLFGAVTQAEKAVERGLGIAESIEDMAGGERVNITESLFGQPVHPDSKFLVKFLRGAERVVDVAVGLPLNLLRTGANGIGYDAFVNKIEEGRQAGRIFYSTTYDPMLRTNYIKRLEDGDNPFLLAQELEHSGAELIGGLLLDPLAVIGKINKAAKLAKADAKAAAQVAMIPKIRSALKVDDISKLADIIPNQTTVDVMRATDEIAEGFVSFGGETKLLARSQRSSQKIINRSFANTMGLFSGNMRKVFGDQNYVEELSSAFRSWTNLRSPDPNEVTRALTHLGELARKGVDVDILFSEDGIRGAALLNEIVTGADGARDISKVFDNIKNADSPQTLIEIMRPGYERATKRMFPTFQQKLNQGIRLTTGERVLFEAEKASEKLLGPFNRFYARTYMGMNPGFVLRNALSNTTHILVDEGTGAFLNFKAMRGVGMRDSLTRRMGRLPEHLIPGRGSFGPVSTAPGIDKLRLGEKGSFFGDLVDKATSIGLKANQRVEERAALRVYYNAFEETMEKQMKLGRAIPAMDILSATGHTDDEMRMLEGLLKTKPTVQEAETAYRAALSTGGMELIRSGTWVPKKARNFFKTIGRWDEVVDGLADAPVEWAKKDYIKFLDEIFADVDNMANHVVHEIENIPLDDERFVTHLNAVAEAVSNSPDMPSHVVTTWKHRGIANALAQDGYRGSLRGGVHDGGVLQDIIKFANNDPEQLAKLDGAIEKLRAGFPDLDLVISRTDSGEWFYNGALDNIRRGKVQALYDDAKGILKAVGDGVMTPNAAWRKLGLSQTSPPPGLNFQQLKNYTWDYHLRRINGAEYAMLRNDEIKFFEAVGESLVQEGFMTADDQISIFSAARQQAVKAIEFDNVSYWKGTNLWMPPQMNSKFDKLMLLAKMNDISSVSRRGAPTKRLINTINKHLGTKFDDILDEGLTLEMAEEALLKARGKKDFVPLHKALTVDEVPDTSAELLSIIGKGAEDVTEDVAREAFEKTAKEAVVKAAAKVTDDQKTRVKAFEDEIKEFGGFGKLSAGTSATTPFTKAGEAGRELTEDQKTRKAVLDRLDGLLEEIEETAGFKPKVSEAGEINLIPDEKEFLKIIIDQEARLAGVAEATERLSGLGEKLPELGIRVAPPWAGETPTDSRFFYEAKKHTQEVKKELADAINDGYGKRIEIFSDKDKEKAFSEYIAQASRNQQQALAQADKVAFARRNFTLLDYEDRTNLDTFASMMFPYQFWHSRTIKNWAFTRLPTDPSLLSKYAQYKDFLADIHAGAPDWWKNNINSNELLGLDSENPVYFNLEATLNPLNGLLGVDYNDPQKRVNNWTNFLDDLGKFGPSTFTPLSVITAMGLHIQGENEAAARWAGRLLPQTAVLDALGVSLKDQESKMNVFLREKLGMSQEGLSSVGGALMGKDLFLNIFSGGIDPHTRNQGGRALQSMVDEQIISPEEMIKAAYTQEGDIWNAGIERAMTSRAGGQMTSYFAGVGFKGRSKNDIQIDQFYNDYFTVWNTRANLGDDEFRQQMNNLQQKYPFMDAVLLARKGGAERDTAIAYHTLGRIPPGSSELVRLSGLSEEVISLFYESKGDMRDWTRGDRMSFMGAISDLMAITEIPPKPVKQEWDAARLQWKDIESEMKARFGDSVLEQIDMFWSLYSDNPDSKDDAFAYLRANPRVQRAMDFRTQAIALNPTTPVAVYYGGIEKIDQYWTGLMRQEATKKYGEEIFALNDLYWVAQNQKSFLKQNPVLKEYWDFKNGFQVIVNQQSVNLGTRMTESKGVQLRDVTFQGVGENLLFGALQNAEGNDLTFVSINQWQQIIGDVNVNLAIKALQGKASKKEETKLREIAQELGLKDEDILIQLVGIAANR